MEISFSAQRLHKRGEKKTTWTDCRFYEWGLEHEMKTVWFWGEAETEGAIRFQAALQTLVRKDYYVLWKGKEPARTHIIIMKGYIIEMEKKKQEIWNRIETGGRNQMKKKNMKRHIRENSDINISNDYNQNRNKKSTLNKVIRCIGTQLH